MNLYLRYRNSPSDPWTEIPDVTAAFPTQPAGTLPVAWARLQTAPEFETPCGCPIDSGEDDHYILKTQVAPMPQSATNDILLFLLEFKQASYHEVKYSQFAAGDFITAGLSLLDCRNSGGLSSIAFRLGAPIADVI
ncbi:MAG: hypothetical protein ABI778_11755 [Ignavibacteriota bacterium]